MRVDLSVVQGSARFVVEEGNTAQLTDQVWSHTLDASAETVLGGNDN